MDHTKANPTAGNGGVQHVSVGDSNDAASIPRCSCGAQCRTHGIITMDDRQAAWQAGYERGVLDGRFGQIENELDVQALRDAADLLQFVKVRTLALAAQGPYWAEAVAGPKPGVVVND